MPHIAEEKVKALVSDILQVPPSDICETTNLVTDLGLDSISFIRLVLSLEECFGITINERDLTVDQFTSIERICALLDKYI